MRRLCVSMATRYLLAICIPLGYFYININLLIPCTLHCLFDSFRKGLLFMVWSSGEKPLLDRNVHVGIVGLGGLGCEVGAANGLNGRSQLCFVWKM